MNLPTPSGHAPLAPSAAKRWMNCPGSYHATKDLPDPGNVWGRKGTFGHEMAATCLTKDIAAKQLQGTVSTDGEFVFDESAVDAVQLYLDVVQGLLLVEGGKLMVEKRVHLSTMVYGTADCLILAEDRQHLHVIDLKLGAGTYVSVENNEQLMIYALAALSDLGIPPTMMSRGVTLHIVQPLFGGDAPWRSVQVTGAELEEFRVKVAAATLAAAKPDAPRVAGEHCKFCLARPDCPALQQQAMAVAQDVFPNLDPVRAVAPPLLSTISAARLGKVLDGADIAEQWIKAVRKEAMERALKGETIPGHKLVERIGHRRWVSEAQAATVLKKFGIDPFEHTLLSPNKAENAAPAAKKHIATMVVRPVTGVSLAPEKDKRPAINAAAALPLLSLGGDE